MAECQEQERKIPVFTVIKNGAILKNIFVINKPPPPSPLPSICRPQLITEVENGEYSVQNNDKEEEILIVGRHPDCHIMLTHPSISRFHLQLHSKPSSQKLSVVDLSSVHGTWVAEKKIEPCVPVEMKEGDTIKIGGSSRVYRLHWIPLSQAYDMENPFVSPLDVPLPEETGEENKAETQQADKSESIEIGKIEVRDPLALETKEEQPCQDANSLSMEEFEHVEGKDLLVVKGNEEGICQDEISASVHHEGVQPLDWILEGIVSLFCDERSELIPEMDIPTSEPVSMDLACCVGVNLSVPEEQQFYKENQIPYHDSVTKVISGRENTESFLRLSDKKSNGLENLIASSSDAKSLMQEDNEMKNDSEVWPHSHMKESMMSSLVSGEVLSEIKTEQGHRENETVPSLIVLQSFKGEMHEKSSVNENLTLPMSLNSARTTEEGCPAAEFFESENHSLPTEGQKQKEIPSFCSPLEDHRANETVPSLIVLQSFEGEMHEKSSVDENLTLPMSLNSVFTNEEGHPAAEFFESENHSLPKEGQEQKEIPSFYSPLIEAESVNSSLPIGEVLSGIMDNKHSQTPQSLFYPKEFEDQENFEVSSLRSDKGPNSHSIWTRRGKPTSVLQIQTGRSRGKTIRGQKYVDLELQKQEDIESKSIAKTLSSVFEERKDEIFTPNKENLSPDTLLLRSLKRKGKLEETKHHRSSRKSFSKAAVSPNIQPEEDVTFSSDKENQTPKVLQEQKLPKESRARHTIKNPVKLGQERVPFQSLVANSSDQRRSEVSLSSATTKSINSVNFTQTMKKVSNSSSVGKERRSWAMVVDATTLLDKESRKSLQLLQGLKGTQLIIPRMVIRELDSLKHRGSLFRRTTEVSSLLEWIEECMVKTKWWIHIQSSLEDGRQIAPTPPASPKSVFSEGSSGSIPYGTTSWGVFSSPTSLTEIVSPTAEDHVLDCALLFRKMKNDGQLVLLSNDVTLKIKAMAEGLICETAQEFRESLVNPFSERFLWADSSPRGLTWSVLDDVVLREKYSRGPLKKTSKGGDSAKGLKLILLHNSHYGKMKSDR